MVSTRDGVARRESRRTTGGATLALGCRHAGVAVSGRARCPARSRGEAGRAPRRSWCPARTRGEAGRAPGRARDGTAVGTRRRGELGGGVKPASSRRTGESGTRPAAQGPAQDRPPGKADAPPAARPWRPAVATPRGRVGPGAVSCVVAWRGGPGARAIVVSCADARRGGPGAGAGEGRHGCRHAKGRRAGRWREAGIEPPNRGKRHTASSAVPSARGCLTGGPGRRGGACRAGRGVLRGGVGRVPGWVRGGASGGPLRGCV
ncbi:hypothetical protein SALBM135S_01315 [Streptomyces alboniger]